MPKKQVILSEVDKRTLACAMSIFVDFVKATEIDNEHVTDLSKAIALISCSHIIDAFDLGEYVEEMEDLESVLR